MKTDCLYSKLSFKAFDRERVVEGLRYLDAAFRVRLSQTISLTYNVNNISPCFGRSRPLATCTFIALHFDNFSL